MFPCLPSPPLVAQMSEEKNPYEAPSAYGKASLPKDPHEEFDEDLERFFDLWGMSHREQEVFGRWLFALIAVVAVLVVAIGLYTL
jgi:hypothetical protein